MVYITRAEEDRILKLIDEGMSLKDICKTMQQEFPNRRWYPMMLSRIIQGIKNRDRDSLDMYSEIEEDLEDIKDWLYEKDIITHIQRSAYGRKLNKVKHKIKDAIISSYKQESAERRVSDLLLEFNRNVLEPVIKMHPDLRWELIEKWKKWDRSRGIPYYKDEKIEKEDIG